MKWCLTGWTFLLCFLLTGCGQGLPQTREMDDMTLMRTMGVDAGEKEGEVLVTVSSGRRASGIQGEQKPPLILSAQQSSVAGACQVMEGQSDSQIFYGHLDQLLLGEELALRGGVVDVLEHFAWDRDLGLGAQVWLVQGGTARNAIHTGGESGVDDRLTTILTDSEAGGAEMECTVGEVLNGLLERGTAFVPALAVTEGEHGMLLERGYGILHQGTLAFWLTGEESRGLELSQGHPGEGLLEVGETVVRLNRAALTCVPVLEEGQLTGLELDLRLAAWVERPGREEESAAVLEQVVRTRAQGWLRAAIERAQKENVDFMGLAAMAGTARPERWQLLREQWKDSFADLNIQVESSVVLSDSGR